MAKTDVTLNPGTGGATVLTDLIGSDYYPASKIIIGAEGVDGGFVSDGNPMPVTGTVNATCSGTITVSQGTAANLRASVDLAQYTALSGRLPVDGSGVTQPVSAASLPLPTGAATESTLGNVLTGMAAAFYAAEWQ